MPSHDASLCYGGRTEAEERRAVVREANTWIGTPFHHMGRVKGRTGGVDCAYCCALVYHAALPDRVPAMDFGYYAPTWNMSKKSAAPERYLATVLALPGVCEVAAPSPGDLALFHWGLAWAHGAVVIDWPVIVHADMNAGFVALVLANEGRLARRQRRFFSFWGNP